MDTKTSGPAGDCEAALAPSTANDNDELALLRGDCDSVGLGKLAEADAYLQILIDQVNALEIRLDGLEDDAQKQKHEQLRVQAKVRS